VCELDVPWAPVPPKHDTIETLMIFEAGENLEA
jgi:hypothetical protein